MKYCLISLLCALFSFPSFAQDNKEFKYYYQGKTLTYTVIDEDAKTCKVSWYSVSGNLVIPEIAKYGNTEYTVIEIGRSAFYYCSGLTSVTIPNSVTYIGQMAFYECSGLTSVIFGNSVQTIGEYAFIGCDGLKKADFASIESLCSINFAGYDTNPLQYAHNLYIDGAEVTDLVIPETIQTIGNDAFRGCSGLKSVTIPNSKTIGDQAFVDCSGLKSVTIPNSVQTIGQNAFSGCTGLTSVYYNAKEPIEGNPNSFVTGWGYQSGIIYDQATLYVPEEAVEKCKLIYPWMNFANIQAYDFSGIEEIEADFNDDEPYEVYNMGGALMGNSLEGLHPAIYIVRQGSKATKVAVR